jgi:hypothetical protein
MFRKRGRPVPSIFTPDSLRALLNAFPEGGAAALSRKITSTLFFEPTIKADDDLTLIIAAPTGESMALALDYEIRPCEGRGSRRAPHVRHIVKNQLEPADLPCFGHPNWAECRTCNGQDNGC